MANCAQWCSIATHKISISIILQWCYNDAATMLHRCKIFNFFNNKNCENLWKFSKFWKLSKKNQNFCNEAASLRLHRCICIDVASSLVFLVIHRWQCNDAASMQHRCSIVVHNCLYTRDWKLWKWKCNFVTSHKRVLQFCDLPMVLEHNPPSVIYAVPLKLMRNNGERTERNSTVML